MSEHDGSRSPERDTKEPNPITTTASLRLDQLLLPGDVVGGRYEIIDILGEGGFGVVYHARQSELGRDVAVKTLRHSIVEYDEAAARFRREAMLARHLSHPNTIRIYDFGQTDEGVLYIVMEYLEGETLDERIEEYGALPLRLVHHIGRQIAKSLTEAHQNGIVHRDLKPSNVFISELAGEPHFIKVLDFGIAKVTQPWEDSSWSDKLTRTGSAFGSPAYMSPEQVRGFGVGPASDIYSFGLIALEIITGKQVVDGNSPFDVAVKQASPTPIPIPLWIANSPLGPCLRRSLAKDTADRYVDASELLDALDEIHPKDIDAYSESLSDDVDFDSLLEEAISYNPEPPLSGETRAAADSSSMRGLIVVGIVVAIVLIALVSTLLLTRDETTDAPARTAPTANAQQEARHTAPKKVGITLAQLVTHHLEASVTGATQAQVLPHHPLGVNADLLPTPLFHQASPANPIIALANAYRAFEAVPTATPLAHAEITTDHKSALPITEGALMASFAGMIPLKTVVISFDSRPKGAAVTIKGSNTVLGETPLELHVVESPRDVVYRFESRGYRGVNLTVSHAAGYNGFAHMEKRKAGKAKKDTWAVETLD